MARAILPRLPESGVENRPKVNKPSKQDEPEDRRENKLKDCHQQPTLKQLAQPRDEETAERRDNVTGGTLTCHENNFSVERGSATGEIARSEAPATWVFAKLLAKGNDYWAGRLSGERALDELARQTPAAIKSNFVAA